MLAPLNARIEPLECSARANADEQAHRLQQIPGGGLIISLMFLTETSKRIATGALTRRLGGAMWAMLRDGRTIQAELLRPGRCAGRACL